MQTRSSQAQIFEPLPPPTRTKRIKPPAPDATRTYSRAQTAISLAHHASLQRHASLDAEKIETC